MSDPSLHDEREAMSQAISQNALTSHLTVRERAEVATVVLDAGFRRAEEPEPQREPSDARAWAAAHAFAKAIKADTGRVVMVNVDHARAALRAAGEVKL